MFIEHGQFGSTFDEDRALRVFNTAMEWRKKNNVYGKKKTTTDEIICFLINILTHCYRYFYR